MGLFNIFTKKGKAKLEENYIPWPIENDPIEETPNFKKYVKRVDKAIDILYPAHEQKLGSCHEIWYIKKILLKECYDIDWKTPSEMNPGVMFD